jgi:hypothetical protein
MMIEFEDHGEEERQLLLRYLDGLKAQGGAGSAGAPPTPPKPNWFWRLLGRVWLAYVRCRYGRPR